MKKYLFYLPLFYVGLSACSSQQQEESTTVVKEEDSRPLQEAPPINLLQE